jgi:hypothetical protein
LKILGLDIGGANTKYTSLDEGYGEKILEQKTIPLELYKTPESLAPMLKKIIRDTKPTDIAITMTAELCDIFHNRNSGVFWIIDQLYSVCTEIPLYFFSIEGGFIQPPINQRMAPLVASANWAATVWWLSTLVEDAIVVDIGSTTTDILPIKGGKSAVLGRNDFERSRYGELVYCGYLRTHPMAVTSSVNIDGVVTPICPEYFSTMGDLHLILGEIDSNAYTIATPDGGPKSKRGAMARLSRLFLTDPEQLKEDQLKLIAKQIVEMHTVILFEKIEFVATKSGLQHDPVIFIGAGKFYKERVNQWIGNRNPNRLLQSQLIGIDPSSCVALLLQSEMNNYHYR